MVTNSRAERAGGDEWVECDVAFHKRVLRSAFVVAAVTTSLSPELFLSVSPSGRNEFQVFVASG